MYQLALECLYFKV